MRLKLTKVSGKEDSHIKPGYCVEGSCHPEFTKPLFGVSIYLFRPIKTSLWEPFDWFQTTAIQWVQDDDNGWTIGTKNSVWKIEKL